MEKSGVDRVPRLLHKYFLVWFQGISFLGWLYHWGIKVLAIQSLDCHSSADARAVSWISILFLNHIHLWAETANLVRGTKYPNLSSPGCLLSVHFSGPRTALPLVALKRGGKGKEHRKAMAGRRWINGKNRWVEDKREENRLTTVLLHCCVCPLLSGFFVHYALWWHEEHTIYFAPWNMEKATSSFKFEITANRGRIYFAKVCKHELL